MKKVYEKPEVDFNELFLFDGVANTCWGYKSGITITVFKDANHNNACDSDEEIIDIHTSKGDNCNAVANDAAAYLEKYDATTASFFISAKENTLSGATYDIFIPVS